MNSTDLDTAIRLLCERFEWHRAVELLVVGGAAAMMSGLLPAYRVTGDCDIISYMPEDAFGAVEGLADEIGSELNLPKHWLNGNIAMRKDLLPDGWQDRRIWIFGGSRLRIFAASRVDLIAMKFVAHRPQDLEDLDNLGVTLDDKVFVESYLNSLPAKGTPLDVVTDSREILESWPLSDGT